MCVCCTDDIYIFLFMYIMLLTFHSNGFASGIPGALRMSPPNRVL